MSDIMPTQVQKNIPVEHITEKEPIIIAPETLAAPVVDRNSAFYKNNEAWRKEKEKWLAEFVKPVLPPKRKVGRPKRGKEVKCEDCGAVMYLKPYQIAKGAGKYCLPCHRKHSKGFKNSIKGLVTCPQFEKYSPEEVVARTIVILVEWLDKEPAETVRALVKTPTFTVDQIINSAMEMVVEESLKRMPEFEKVGAGIWRLKAKKQSLAHPQPANSPPSTAPSTASKEVT
jgi:hypothetical protein